MRPTGGLPPVVTLILRGVRPCQIRGQKSDNLPHRALPLSEEISS